MIPSGVCMHIQDLLVTHRPKDRRQPATRLIHVPELHITHGVVTAILGPSGSGKSTLLRAINRLNDCWEDLHTAGQVTLRLENALWRVYPEAQRTEARQGEARQTHPASNDPRSACPTSAHPAYPLYPVDRLRRKAGMVFQHPHLLPLSIARNILLPLTEGAGYSRDQAESRMAETLKQVGLWNEVKNRLHESASRLSGGQMQRLCLARTLALEPEILLLDEPTASLDANAARQVEEAIHCVSGTLTTILVTHSQKQADRLAAVQRNMRDGILEEQERA